MSGILEGHLQALAFKRGESPAIAVRFHTMRLKFYQIIL